MSLKCVSCGASIAITERERRRLAGKFLACPQCGDAKRLPPWGRSTIERPAARLWLAVGAGVLLLSGLAIAGKRAWTDATNVSAAAPVEAPKIDGLKMPEKPFIEPIDEMMMVIGVGGVGPTIDGFEILRWWPVRPVQTTDLGICYAARLRWKLKNKYRDKSGDFVGVFSVTQDEFTGKVYTGRINWYENFAPKSGNGYDRVRLKAAEEIRNVMDAEKAE